MPTVVNGDVPASAVRGKVERAVRSELSLREAAGATEWASAQGNNSKARDNGSYVPQPLDFRNSITAPANVVNMAVIRAEPHGGASRPSPRRQRVTKLSSTAASQFVASMPAALLQHNTTELHRVVRDALPVLRRSDCGQSTYPVWATAGKACLYVIVPSEPDRGT
jgi:hypothetical protein